MTEQGPEKTQSTYERLALLAVLLVLILSRIAMFVGTGFTADDAFITYRYADQIARGEGFVYNTGERVQGTSSPVFAILLSAVSAAGGHAGVPLASRVISLTADAITLILLWYLLAHFNVLSRVVVGLFFALYPKVVFVCSEGMEISLVLALMVGGLLALRRGRVLVGSLLFGLLLVTRIDAILWVVVCMVTQRPRKHILAAMCLLAAPPAGWAWFSKDYFGAVVPNAIIAKSLSWSELYPLFDPVRILRGYFPSHGLVDSPMAVQVLAGSLALLPVLVALVIALRKEDGLGIFPAFFLLYTLAFSFGRVIMADWYYLPGFVAYGVSLGILAEYLIARPLRDRLRPIVSVVTGVILLSILIALNVVAIRRWSVDPGAWFRDNLVRVGDWLEAHAEPESSVLLEPIGYVGWRSGMRVHDVIGMVSPEVLRYRIRSPRSNAWFFQYLRDFAPDFVVLQRKEIHENRLFLGYGDAIFRNDVEFSWFAASYVALGPEATGGTELSTEYVVFKRLPVPVQ